jgi:lysyl-tRNA synthetase class 2
MDARLGPGRVGRPEETCVDRALIHKLQRRHDALGAVRGFFEARDFLEVDPPQLVVAPTTEPHIDPLALAVRGGFEDAPARRYLHTSPELALKRVLAAGVERCYGMAHVFRDGERSATHLPEFMLLEWYRARATLEDLVTDCEELLRALGERFADGTSLERPDGSVVEVGVPFERRTVAELFSEHAGIDLRVALSRMADGDEGALVEAAKTAGLKLRPGADFEDAFFQVMDTRVEPAIGRERPVVVSRWPRRMAVLARACDDDELFAERFELYAGGLELANAFDELTDPVEQRARFEADNRARLALGKESLPVDELFLEDLARMPRASGIALGVDRLLMLVFGAGEIDDVVPLPFR